MSSKPSIVAIAYSYGEAHDIIGIERVFDELITDDDPYVKGESTRWVCPSMKDIKSKAVELGVIGETEARRISIDIDEMDLDKYFHWRKQNF